METPGPIARFWDWYAALSLRRPFLLFALGAALFGGCLPFAIRLYRDLHTDLRELLPQSAPAAVGLVELEKRIGGLSHLAIVVQTDDLKAGERFVDALGAKLKELPPSLIAQVHWRVTEEKEFLDTHGALYADLKDLQAVRANLRAQVAKANPLLVDDSDSDTPSAAPNVDEQIGRIKKAYAKLDRFPDGDLAGEDGHTRVMLLSPPGAAVSLKDDQRIFHEVERTVAEVNPKSFHPSIQVGYGGEVRGVIEAQQALVHDLEISGVLVLVSVGLALALYYRTIRAVPLLVLPLFTGVSVTFALSRAVVHYLNPNTAFLGSIIIGNGINAGIILLARFLEERRQGQEIAVALPTALRSTWLATFAASTAAAASYGSLGAVSFRGFNQFAFIGFFGMIICWFTTYALMPPLLALQDRYWPFRKLTPHTHGKTVGWAGPIVHLLVRKPAWPVVIALGLAAASVYAGTQFAKDPIQYDFRKLGSRSGVNRGAGYWDKHVDEVLQSYQTPTVVMSDKPEQATAVAAAVTKAKKDGLPGTDTIDSVVTLQEFLPLDQQEKLSVLRDIFNLLDKKPRAELPPEVRRLRERTKLEPVSISDVPANLTRAFVEKDGQRGRVVLVYPTLSTDSANGRAQIAHTKAVREASLKVDPGARIAGQIVLTTDIVAAITNDGALTVLLSFCAVALLTLIVMRSLRDAAWVIGSLSLGVLWMAGAMTVMSLKLNFVNFAVLPITFGIGVDYAVNLYQRYRQAGSVEVALSSSGGAVALCSLTTIIGYATLVTADNQAIQSFGLTAVVGEITCLTAALFALPAILSWRDRRAAVVQDAAHQGA
ncbi:MAG TPA: MMPL family transporter [Myxococcales bacterium]|nr:MMPL family transporter [Myxococcales bacterium]